MVLIFLFQTLLKQQYQVANTKLCNMTTITMVYLRERYSSTPNIELTSLRWLDLDKATLKQININPVAKKRKRKSAAISLWFTSNLSQTKRSKSYIENAKKQLQCKIFEVHNKNLNSTDGCNNWDFWFHLIAVNCVMSHKCIL